MNNDITLDVIEITDFADDILSSLSTKTDGIYFQMSALNELLDFTDCLIKIANREISKIYKSAFKIKRYASNVWDNLECILLEADIKMFNIFCNKVLKIKYNS